MFKMLSIRVERTYRSLGGIYKYAMLASFFRNTWIVAECLIV